MTLSKDSIGAIKKVTIEYEAGTYTVEGEDAVTWKSMVDGQATLAHVHGAKYLNLNWKFAPLVPVVPKTPKQSKTPKTPKKT